MEKNTFTQLIDRYLAGSASEAEQKLVEEYIRRMEAEGAAILEDKDEQNLKQAIWMNIQQQVTHQPPRLLHIAWYKRKVVRWAAAVAASIILVFSLGIAFFTKSDESTIAVKDYKRTDSATVFLRHVVNTTGSEKRILLPEGSLIVLADQSELTYREPFTNKREITLKGKAFFKVAKDKTRPFTVISGDISTTALGTEFTVTAFEKSSQIIVRLYEGKVVVKAVEKNNRKLKNGVYLLPGQEFVYVNQIITPKVKSFKLNNTAVPETIIKEEFSRDNPSLPKTIKGSWYMFNNQPLPQVIDQLAEMFNVSIVYEKKDIQNIYFTGKYYKSDSLEEILKQIGTLHNLTITKNNSGFTISK